MRVQVLAAVLVLSGCPDSLEPSEHEARAVEAAASGWEQSLEKLPAGCDLDLLVRHANKRDFSALCGVVAKKAASCVDSVTNNEIVLAPGVECGPDGEPCIHETLHVLERCASGVYDYGHDNPKVWKEAGGAASAQAIAESLMPR